MKRSHLILGVVLLFQFALILLLRSPFTDASHTTQARPLLPALEAVTPMRLELRQTGNDAPLVLTKQGERWTVDSLSGFPADGRKVKSLIQQLEELKVRRPVVTSSRYHKAFKVTEDDNEARLKLFGASDDEPQADLLFGTSPNYRSVHVRVGSDDPVYEVRGIATYDLQADPNGWIEKELVGRSEAAVSSLRITNPSGTFELRKQDGTWKVASPESSADVRLDQAKVSSLVSAAATVRLAEAVGPTDDGAQGLAEPAATIVLQTDDGGEVTVRIGSKVADEDSQRYVTASGFGFTGTIWDSTAKKFIADGLDKLEATAADPLDG